MSDAADRSRVRAAAVRVGLLVGTSSAAVLVAGVAVLLVVLNTSARPEREHGGPPHPDSDRFVVDLDHVVWWLVGLGVAGAVLMAAIGWLVARSAVRPLATALAGQRRFVADASHELRTPLTAISARVQLLQRRLDRGEPIDELVRLLRRDVDVMDAVLAELLLLAEGGHAEIPDGGADPVDCARDAMALLEPVASEHGVRLTLAPTVGAGAEIPAPTLIRLITVLLDNAVQHAPQGSAVEVALASVGDTVEIRVRDHGPGVALEDAERIFERFARSGEHGRRRGFGLGLALAREGAERFGGSVELTSSSAAGSTFTLRLPRARTPRSEAPAPPSRPIS
ncbi:sensor histidine kinase [Agromyces soli]|uniref:histidine kinase n=1 Tax=Agromyces soli TaxID=659012 RepID=A0ABY4AWH1_9MICO|nr:HAMP domain-containing sensor histidine kinase [Agromyces soli]UOE27504.1 HAMP domain-containing histidine kinase [Agromyces soli]